MAFPDSVPLLKRNLSHCIDGRAEALIGLLQGHPGQIAEAATVRDCVRHGYAPKGYGLADFTVVRAGGRFHLFHIPRVAGNDCIHPANEHWFGHAVSEDLDAWVTGHPPLAVEPAHYYESAHIWAPFVLEHERVHYMFYTGLSAEPTQVLCLATSTDPDLNVWRRSEQNPILPLEGLAWHWKNRQGHLRQGRDPHVVRVGDHFLMAYTAMHTNGCPAVGGMISHDLKQWEDIGPILYRPLRLDGWMPESVNIQPLADGKWVLIPSFGPGLEYYVSDDPHAWHDSEPLPLEYVGGGGRNEAMGPELLFRDDERGQWLMAFFESCSNRLYLGILHTRGMWRLERLSDPAQLEPWRKRLAAGSY